MKITFIRKKSFVVFFAKVPIYVDGNLYAELPNGKEYIYNGVAETIKLIGPGVIRNVEFELDTYEQDISIEFKPAFGFVAGGFKIKIFANGELIKKIRKTF